MKTAGLCKKIESTRLWAIIQKQTVRATEENGWWLQTLAFLEKAKASVIPTVLIEWMWGFQLLPHYSSLKSSLDIPKILEEKKKCFFFSRPPSRQCLTSHLTGPELMLYLLQSTKCWDYWCVPPPLAFVYGGRYLIRSFKPLHLTSNRTGPQWMYVEQTHFFLNKLSHDKGPVLLAVCS